MANVGGLAPGLYHYNCERHVLTPLEILEAAEARHLANEFTSGQSFPRNASALFIITARFYSRQVYDPPVQATVRDLVNILRKPGDGARLHRLFHGTDCLVSDPLRLTRAAT